MRPERWARLKSLFSAALNNDTAGRREFAAVACAGDTSLRRDLSSLLRHHGEEDQILDREPPSPKAPHDFPPGTVLAGRFEIVKLLGTGGMGSVFEAVDVISQERVALKALHPGFAADPQAADRFRNEVQMARRIAHRNVCRTHDLFRHESDGLTTELISMELLDGESLLDYLARTGPLPEKLIRDWLEQIVEGLAAAHDAGVIHRDLKPSNIMIVNGRIVLTDFGLAQKTTRDVENPASMMAGTPAYMAPEQFQGRSAGIASDIYSLGVVLCEMSTGSRILPKDAHGSIAGVVSRCVHPDPAKRFSSARQIVAHLEPNRMARRAAIAALVLIVGGVTVYLFYTCFAPYTPPAAAERWYQRGIDAMAGGANATAAAQFQEAIRLAPDYPQAHARLAFALYTQDYGEPAAREIQTATDLARRQHLTAESKREITTIQEALAGRQKRAAEDFKALAESGDRARRILHLVDAGLMAEASEQPKLAKELYEMILREEPEAPAAHLRLAVVASRLGIVDKADASFRTAEDLYRKLGDAIGRSESMLSYAAFLGRQSRAAEGLRTLDGAREFARAANNTPQQIRILLQTAVLRRVQGDTVAATELTEEALSMARREQMNGLLAQGLLDLGNAHLRARDYDTAAICFEEALADAERMDSSRRQAQALASLASVRTQQHRPEEARALLDRAIPFYRKSGYRRELAQTLAVQVSVLMMLGDIKAVEPIVREQVSLAETTQNEIQIGRAKSVAGGVLLKLERLPEAEVYLADAQSKLAASEDATLPAMAAVNRADALWRLGRYADAERVLGEAEALQKRAKEAGQVQHRRNMVRAQMLLSRREWRAAAQAAEAALASSALANPIERLDAERCLALASAHLNRQRPLLPPEPAAPQALHDIFFRVRWRLAAAEERLVRKRAKDAREIIEPVLADTSRYGLSESAWWACSIRAVANESGVARSCVSQQDQLRIVLGTFPGSFLARPDVSSRNSE